MLGRVLSGRVGSLKFLFVLTETNLGAKMSHSKKVSKKSKLDFTAHLPKNKASRKSLGSYYIKKNASDSWSLMLETSENGKRSQETIPKALHFKFGLNSTMTLAEARAEIKKYNLLRSVKIEDVRSQMFALKRSDRLVGVNQKLFPPELVKKFREKIEELHATHRYKVRMSGVFDLIQLMTSKEFKILPSQYADEVAKFTNYFIKRKYSVSYSMDIIYMLNWWGKFYAKNTGSYFEKIEGIKANARNAIDQAHNFKTEGMRTEALAIDEEIMKRINDSIDLKNEKEVQWAAWVEASYRFGLRPSELDAIIGNVETEFKDGVETLMVEQKKTVFDGSDKDKVKRIPILCEKQENCLEKIRTGQMERPHPQWIDEKAKDPKKKYKRHEKFDCYSGRKGASSYWRSELDQKFEDCVSALGHRSVDTTWRHYRNKEKIFFTETEFTKKKKIKAVS